MLFHAQSVTCLMATLVFSMNNCAHDTMIASNPCLDPLNVLLVLYRRALQSSVLPRLAMTRALGDHMLKMPAGDLDQSNKGVLTVLTVLTWYETLTTDVLPDAAQWCGQQRAGHHLHGCHEAGLMMRCAKLPRHGIRFRYREQDLGSGPREIPQITHPLYVYTIVYISFSSVQYRILYMYYSMYVI